MWDIPGKKMKLCFRFNLSCQNALIQINSRAWLIWFLENVMQLKHVHWHALTLLVNQLELGSKWHIGALDGFEYQRNPGQKNQLT